MLRTTGFNKLNGDPIFEEEKERVQGHVQDYEKEIKKINRDKIEYENTEICK